MSGTILWPFVELLSKRGVVLASASPRRREILSILRIPFTVRDSNFAEDLDKKQFASAAAYTTANAVHKAQYVSTHAKNRALLVIGADTVVVDPLDGSILEKPQSSKHAFEMLSRLRGGAHEVVTSVCLLLRMKDAPNDWKEHRFHATTRVFMPYWLDDETLQSYVRTQEPLGKAGAYAIQGVGGAGLVERIDGDYYNVVGFPLHAFCRELRTLLDTSGYEASTTMASDAGRDEDDQSAIGIGS